MRRELLFRRKMAATAVASCFVCSVSLANPTGPAVVHGNAAIHQVGNLLRITNSPNAIINWQSFSIGANEITRFIQQSASSAVLNRVVTQNPSAILGALQSNGRVFLINPNGILFGAGAQINVAGLVASTLNLSDADFLAGRMRFTDAPGERPVVNQGSITTRTGGNVYLVGPAVANSGVITSPKGEVIIAAGNSVELVDPGTPNLRVEITAPDNRAVNLGQIIANAGRVGIFAGLINNSGTIRADTAEATEDGRILLKATQDVALTQGSLISAVGPRNGTLTIEAGGDVAVSGAVNTGPQTIMAGGALLVHGSPGAAARLDAFGGQTINAKYVEVIAQGGDASITNSGFGDQTITTTGMNAAGEGLAVRSLVAGDASIENTPSWHQVISVTNADRLTVEGSVGDASILANEGRQTISMTGSGANAIVIGSAGALGSSRVEGPGQTITAGVSGQSGSISVIAGLGGAGTFAAISGNSQLVSTTGNVRVTGGSGMDSSIARIGGSADLTLNAGGDVVISGGNAPNSAAAIGGDGTLFGSIAINAGGNVIVDATVGGKAWIGSSAFQGGEVSINAGGNIQLLGGVQPAAIRGWQGVDLHADSVGGTISENPSGLIETMSLTTTSHGNTTLIGPNQIEGFNGSSVAGNLLLNNNSDGLPLSVSGIQLSPLGALTLNHAGANQGGTVVISGDIYSGDQSICATGDILIFSSFVSEDVIVNAAGTQTIAAGNGILIGSTSLVNAVGAQTISAGGVLSVRGGNGTGLSARVVGGSGQTISAADIHVGGGELGTDNFAEILQTGPNASQTIVASNNVTISGGGGAGNSFGRIRNDGTGPQTITAGGTLEVRGGAGSGQSARVVGGGGQFISAMDVVVTGGAGSGSFAEIRQTGPTAGQEITVSNSILIVGGNVGPDNFACICNDGNGVVLQAHSISQGPNGEIRAGTLATHTTDGASLVGTNQVSSYSATNTLTGEISLNNVLLPLSITGITNAAGGVSVATSGALTVTGDVTSSGTGAVNLSGVGFINNATISGAGGVFIDAGGGIFTNNPGAVISGNGTLDATGTVFTNHGTLRPTGSGAVGTLNIAGDAVFSATSVLEIDAQGATPGQYDVVAVTGNAGLGGQLNVTNINGYVPVFADTLVPVTFASSTGTFTVSPASTYLEMYNATNLTLFYSPLNSRVGASGNWIFSTDWSLGQIPAVEARDRRPGAANGHGFPR